MGYCVACGRLADTINGYCDQCRADAAAKRKADEREQAARRRARLRKAAASGAMRDARPD